MSRDFGYLFKHIQHQIKERMNYEMKDCNLTSQQGYVLYILEQNGGSLSQKEIEDKLNVSHPTIVGIITRMENNGFVKTHLLETDRRIKIVELTEIAYQFKETVERNRSKLNEEIVKGMSEEEMETLEHLLNRINNNLSFIKEDSND
ncbi:MAG: MarR family transcriptional regulator [Erysipelotrichaceae bacterium]|nr:MarR family transcriptional regulator [Erysipelotrichaceae bacterium]